MLETAATVLSDQRSRGGEPSSPTPPASGYPGPPPFPRREKGVGPAMERCHSTGATFHPTVSSPVRLPESDGRDRSGKSSRYVDAPAGPGRRGMGGPECGPESATGREGEPIDDGSIILCCAAGSQSRSDPSSGPLVLRISSAIPQGCTVPEKARMSAKFVLQ